MQKIKFGVSISLSGRYSVQGRESFEGLNLWVKDIYHSGGILVRKKGKKLPVKLIYYDDESSVERCRGSVKKLIVEDKVDILIGPYSSGLTLSAVPIAQSYRKILWNHGGSSDDIMEKEYTNIISAITPARGEKNNENRSIE
jgi:branched-chain amino acid transport system substrate-binding protein